MKPIETVAFIGLGALGINFAQLMRQRLPKDKLLIIADQKRIDRYQRVGVYANEKRCDFCYVCNQEKREPVDLAIFCTKFNGLKSAMNSMKGFIGSDTLIMSAINGISSEEILSTMYPKENIIYTVAQGMDATKVKNQLTCHNRGELCFGDITKGSQQEKIEAIVAFFQKIDFPYSVKEDILHHQWGKFMLNVGLNQVVALHHGTYATIQRQGKEREEMMQAMREVIAISQCTGIHLQEEELLEWVALTDTLAADGKPSMAQDVEAKRPTEVELFAGTMCRMAREYNVKVPMNAYLYEKIKEIEASYA